jgi:hypothetical protein
MLKNMPQNGEEFFSKLIENNRDYAKKSCLEKT